MAEPNHDLNLDDNSAEYFEFTIFSHNYKFRYPTGEEIEEIEKAATEKKNPIDVFSKFITPIGEAPKFEETWKKMTIKHIRKFTNMLKVEFGNEGN